MKLASKKIRSISKKILLEISKKDKIKMNLSNKKLFRETGIRMLGFKDGLTKMLEDKKIWE